MDYYTVISSDLYSLSCVAVSQLEDMVQDELMPQDIFLVSEKISSDDQMLSTRTGYMSKFVSTQHLKDALARMLDYNRVSSDVLQMSAIYAKKEDLKTGNLSVDNLPNPYIISSMVFKDGVPSCLYGYRLLDVLKDTIICVDYEKLSVMDLSSQTFVSPTASVSTLNVTNINNDFIQHMEDVVPDGASNENKLADISTMMSAILEYAPTFRGNLENWSQAEIVDNYLPDEQGNRIPNRNDYMVLSVASTYPNITPRLQDTWRFRYVGNWETDKENGWQPEYKIEIPPLTPQQKAALDSEITKETKVTHGQNEQVGDGETKLIFIDTNGRAKTGVDFTKNIPLATSNSVGGMKLYSNDEMDTMGDNNYPVQLDTSQTVLSGKAYVHVPIVTPLSGVGIQYDNDGTIRISPNNIETWTFTLRDEHDNETTITRRFVVINESCLISVEVGSGIGQVSAVPGDMSSIVLYGDSIEISAFPGFGQKFVGWKSDSSQDYESTNATYEFAAVKDKNLTGYFEEYTDNPMTQVRFVDQNFENYNFFGMVTKGNLFNAQPALRPDEEDMPTANWNVAPIETVNFGKTVTSLGPALFRNCPTLKNVSIQEGVGSIEYRVFSDCANLSSITIPQSLSSLGNSAFATCRKLSSINNLDNIKKIGEYVFYKTSLTSISMPEVSSVGNNAFRDCTYLSSIYVPKVKYIDEYAFQNCSSLTSISTPEVTAIGKLAFSSCKGISSAYMPQVLQIDQQSFQQCYSLSSVEMPELTALKINAFQQCSSLISVNVPKLTDIRGETFSGCIALSSVNIPKVKNIYSMSFYNCSSLITVYMPEIEYIQPNAFQGCTSLSSITLPDNGIRIPTEGETIFYDRKPDCKFFIQYKDSEHPSEDTANWLSTRENVDPQYIEYVLQTQIDYEQPEP